MRALRGSFRWQRIVKKKCQKVTNIVRYLVDAKIVYVDFDFVISQHFCYRLFRVAKVVAGHVRRSEVVGGIRAY